MKNKSFIVSLISQVILYGVANLFLFLLLPPEKIALTSFWVSWSFTFPFCLITTILVTIYSSKRENQIISRLPLILAIQYSAIIVYLIAGLVLMFYGPSSPTPAWLVEAVITALYVILIMYAVVSTNYITKSIKFTKEKVFYIKSLQTDIDNCISMVTDKNLAQSLSLLSDKIRYSDPMSSVSLRQREESIQNIVSEIVAKISNEEYENVPALISKASIEIDARNNLCKTLKWERPFVKSKFLT